MITWVVDGKLCDGGPNKGWPHGWQLFSPLLVNVIKRAERRKTQMSREKFGRIRSKLYFLRDEVDSLKLPKPTPRPRAEAGSRTKNR